MLKCAGDSYYRISLIGKGELKVGAQHAVGFIQAPGHLLPAQYKARVVRQNVLIMLITVLMRFLVLLVRSRIRNHSHSRTCHLLCSYSHPCSVSSL